MERYYYRDNHISGSRIPDFFTENRPGRIRGKFRVMDATRRGFPSAGKHRDFFIDIPESKEKLRLPINVVDRFHALADVIDETQNRPGTEEDMLLPYHPLGTRRNTDPKRLGHKLRIKDGDLVFYAQQGGQVTEISFSAIWRRSSRRIDAFFKNAAGKEILPFNRERKLLSPAERVFGFVEDRPERDKGSKKDSDMAATYAGHVRFSEARWDRPWPEDADSPYMDEVTLKILDSPKPPSPALYFRPKTGSNKHKNAYIEKDRLNPEAHHPQGRKFYLHKYKDDGEPWKTHPENEKKRLKQKTRITPLRKGLKFTFCIDFDNLDNYELGMLLYTLCPNDTFQHKIGMGKPLGLGSVRLTIESVETIDRRARYCDPDPFSSSRYDKRCDWIKLRDCFSNEAEGISKAAIEALEALGDPAKVTKPVQYPQVANNTGADMELENYRWWVANDKPGRHAYPPPNGGQSLKPLDKTGTTDLPILQKLRFKK